MKMTPRCPVSGQLVFFLLCCGAFARAEEPVTFFKERIINEAFYEWTERSSIPPAAPATIISFQDFAPVDILTETAPAGRLVQAQDRCANSGFFFDVRVLTAPRLFVRPASERGWN